MCTLWTTEWLTTDNYCIPYTNKLSSFGSSAFSMHALDKQHSWTDDAVRRSLDTIHSTTFTNTKSFGSVAFNISLLPAIVLYGVKHFARHLFQTILQVHFVESSVCAAFDSLIRVIWKFCSNVWSTKWIQHFCLFGTIFMMCNSNNRVYSDTKWINQYFQNSASELMKIHSSRLRTRAIIDLAIRFYLLNA